MDGMTLGAMALPAIAPWSALDFWPMFVMWAVMMVGMMLSSATPMIVLYAAVSRRQRGHVFAPTGVLAAGYLVAWTASSLAATAAQWALEQAALLSPMSTVSSSYRAYRWNRNSLKRRPRPLPQSVVRKNRFFSSRLSSRGTMSRA